MSKVQMLKVVINEQLVAAADEIFGYFKERKKINDNAVLRGMVNERLIAATDEIFDVFEKTVAVEDDASRQGDQPVKDKKPATKARKAGLYIKIFFSQCLSKRIQGLTWACRLSCP